MNHTSLVTSQLHLIELLAVPTLFHKFWGRVLHLPSACSSKFLLSAALGFQGHMLPRNWVRLLVGIELKDTTESKIGRRKDLVLAASKENIANVSQSSVSPNSRIGEGLS